mgnify:CR=1 FL=1
MCMGTTKIRIPPPPPMPDIEALLAAQPELPEMELDSPVAPEIRTKLDDIGASIRKSGMSALQI